MDHGHRKVFCFLFLCCVIKCVLGVILSFPCSSVGKESACSAGDLGLIPGLEKKMGTYPSILAWKISWTEEPGGL